MIRCGREGEAVGEHTIGPEERRRDGSQDSSAYRSFSRRSAALSRCIPTLFASSSASATSCTGASWGPLVEVECLQWSTSSLGNEAY